MNQEILIVFTLFLLITILLMLLLSDAKGKSNRTRILVYISGNPIDSQTINNINSFLEKIVSEDNFVFTLADNTNPENFYSPASYSAILRFQPYAFTLGQNEFNEIQQSSAQATLSIDPDEYPQASLNRRSSVWVDPASPHIIYIAAGPNASRCNNQDFLQSVRQAILQTVLLKNNQ